MNSEELFKMWLEHGGGTVRVIGLAAVAWIVVANFGVGTPLMLNDDSRSPMTRQDTLGNGLILHVRGQKATDKCVAGTVGIHQIVNFFHFKWRNIAISIGYNRWITTLKQIETLDTQFSRRKICKKRLDLFQIKKKIKLGAKQNKAKLRNFAASEIRLQAGLSWIMPQAKLGPN